MSVCVGYSVSVGGGYSVSVCGGYSVSVCESESESGWQGISCMQSQEPRAGGDRTERGSDHRRFTISSLDHLCSDLNGSVQPGDNRTLTALFRPATCI